MKSKIVIIGTGNVAHILGKELAKKNTIVQVYGRDKQEAKGLGKMLKAKSTNEIKQIIPEADFYLCCISDDAIQKLTSKLNVKGIVLHTSGSIKAEALKKHASHGVLYPLQTFNKLEVYDWKEIPVFIEGNNRPAMKRIRTLAQSISKTVFEADSPTRKQIHLAAVFANNFTNHLLDIAQELTPKKFRSKAILQPLILKTIENAFNKGAEITQTGPARRRDKKVIQLHLKMLGNNKKTRDIYDTITKSIIHKYHG